MPAPVEVDVAPRAAAVGVVDVHPVLEDIGVAGRIVAGRLRAGQVEELAELGQEELVVGPLPAAAVLPAFDEGLDGLVGGR